MRVVLDTNIFISALIKDGACRNILKYLKNDRFIIVFSKTSIEELTRVAHKTKFRKLIAIADLNNLIDAINGLGKLVNPLSPISASRDIKDNFILETAVSGRANIIVTGDDDLLVLNPFRGIRIINPADFIKLINK